MAEHEAVLFANEAFYRAFADRDSAAMDAVWAAEAPVACIHPGWNALTGRDQVMASWRRILGGGGGPAITCHNARALLQGACAFVICHEHIGSGFLIATNIFVLEGGRWKMVHHQAGPTTQPVPEEESEDSMH